MTSQEFSEKFLGKKITSHNWPTRSGVNVLYVGEKRFFCAYSDGSEGSCPIDLDYYRWRLYEPEPSYQNEILEAPEGYGSPATNRATYCLTTSLYCSYEEMKSRCQNSFWPTMILIDEKEVPLWIKIKQ